MQNKLNPIKIRFANNAKIKRNPLVKEVGSRNLREEDTSIVMIRVIRLERASLLTYYWW